MHRLVYIIDETEKTTNYAEAMAAKAAGHKVKDALEFITPPPAKPCKYLYLSARVKEC